MQSRISPLHLTLVVPGLARALGERITEGVQLPFLESLLGKANLGMAVTLHYESLLFTLFNIPQPEPMDIPLAPMMYPWDKGSISSEEGWWLRADPVYLRPDRDRLVLFGPRYLELNEAESQSLATIVAPLFTEYGWQFEALQPDRWYLRLPQPERVAFTALGIVEGKYLEPALPAGADGSRWRALLNEIQMLLHDCPINREREDRGLPVVNSLWFWGAGEAPLCSTSSWQQVGWGQDPLLQAIAAYCKVPGQLAPLEASTWLEGISAPGDYLLVLDSLLPVIDPFRYREVLLALEKNWFSALYAALRNRRLTSLTLYPLNGHCYYLTWLRTWYLWRRPRPLIKNPESA